jgi:hypothetical protein
MRSIRPPLAPMPAAARTSLLQIRHVATLVMLLAAAALLAPGAAVAAPTVIQAADSAPVSLLHGETTPPSAPGRAPSSVTRSRRRRRLDGLVASARRVRRLLRRSTVRSGPERTLVDDAPPRAGPPSATWSRGPPSCGPPTTPSSSAGPPTVASTTPPPDDRRPAGRCPRGPDVHDGARSGADAVTPTVAASRTLRSGAGTAQGALRDTERRDEHPIGCRCRSRRTSG